MPRRLYVLSFVATAITFVPVIFLVCPPFPFSMTGPCCYQIYCIFDDDWLGYALLIKTFCCLQLAAYTAAFYAVAKVTGWVAEEEPRMRPIIQGFGLLLIFSCSFLRVIHAESFVTYTGTYTFWEACHRFFKLV